MSTSPLAPSCPRSMTPNGARDAAQAGAVATLRRFASPLVLGLAIIALAAAVRLVQLGEPSLTGHEARQVNATLEDGFAQPRSLPVLIGLMNRSLAGLSGRSEFVVRLPYALAGIAGVALLFEFCRRRIDPCTAVFVAGVAAVHPVLLTTSRSISLGSIEAMFAVALLWVGLNAFSKPTRHSLATFAGVSVLALACTFTSVLLIAAWLPLLFWAVRRPARAQDRTVRLWPSALAATAVVVAACWVWFWWFDGGVNAPTLSRAQEVPFRIWPWGFAVGQIASWCIDVAYGMVGYARIGTWLAGPLDWMVGGLSVIAAVFGCGLLWQRCRILLAWGSLVVVGIGLTLVIDHPVLATLNTLVFLFPLVCICVGSGLAVLMRRAKRTVVTVGLILAALLLPGQHAVRAGMIDPAKPEHLRPIFQYIADHQQPGDAVFVWHQAVDAFYFYWNDPLTPVHIQPPEDPTIKVQFRRGDFLKQLDAFVAQHGRVWLVFAHGGDQDKMSYLTRLERYVKEFGVYRLADVYSLGDVSARLLLDATLDDAT